jgi:subfamily B ATP-binding cassette protein MsbA
MRETLMRPTGPNTAKTKKASRVTLDAHSRSLLRRFLADWVWPRWRELLGALALTAMLAATTGGYPLIIKHSFDTLLQGKVAALPLVLAAILVVTMARGAFLYLQNVATHRVGGGRWSDKQKSAN